MNNFAKGQLTKDVIHAYRYGGSIKDKDLLIAMHYCREAALMMWPLGEMFTLQATALETWAGKFSDKAKERGLV